MTSPPLPMSSACVELHLLDGGSWTPLDSLFHSGAEAKPYRMYDWAFYIQHPNLNRHLIWDVGMTSDHSLLPPAVREMFYKKYNPQGPRRSLTEQLAHLGVNAKDIDTVVFSHAHWDHCRPIRDIFPNARGYFGPGSKKHCSPGHKIEPHSQWDGAFFDPSNATEQWEELEGPWIPFTSFNKATDFFGDGSLWLVQAPGHMPGNLFAAVRIEGGSWVILGGDCCHSRALLNGDCDVAQFEIPGRPGKFSAHLDLENAKTTIGKLRIMEREHGVHMALAHDEMWMRQGTDTVLMSLLDVEMELFVKERLASSGIP